MGNTGNKGGALKLKNTRKEFLANFRTQEGRHFSSDDLRAAHAASCISSARHISKTAALDIMESLCQQYGCDFDRGAAKKLLKGDKVDLQDLQELLFDVVGEDRDFLSTSLDQCAESHHKAKRLADLDIGSWISIREQRSAPEGLQALGRMELSLVFAKLDFGALCCVSLCCRYFYTVLSELGPAHWRRLHLRTVAQLTHSDLSALIDAPAFSRIRYLTIGSLEAANMLKGDQLARILGNLRHLTSLRLSWCHLLYPEHWLHVSSESLRTLCLYKVRPAAISLLLRVFPRLKHFGYIGDALEENIFRASEADQLSHQLESLLLPLPLPFDIGSGREPCGSLFQGVSVLYLSSWKRMRNLTQTLKYWIDYLRLPRVSTIVFELDNMPFLTTSWLTSPERPDLERVVMKRDVLGLFSDL